VPDAQRRPIAKPGHGRIERVDEGRHVPRMLPGEGPWTFDHP
jgi:hypothetical protein